MAEDQEQGGGVGTLNTGDSGSNDGGEATTGGGGGSNSGSNSSGGNSGNDTTISDNAQYLSDKIDSYLELSFKAYTFEKVVELYVDNKLGFKKLEKEYTDANPEEDKAEVKQAVEEAREEAIKDFTEGASKDELKAKYDNFKINAASIRKNAGNIVKDFTKDFTEAAMPTSLGPVSPNPYSVLLKLYNAIVRIKRHFDFIVVSMRLFMTAAESLGLDKTDEYKRLINVVAVPLKNLEAAISRKEKDNEAEMAMAEMFEEAKKKYVALTKDGNKQNGLDVERVIAEEFGIYEWPLKPLKLKKLSDAVLLNKKESLRNFRARLGLEYASWYMATQKQIEENYKQSLESVISGSSGDGGSTSDAVFSGSSPNIDIS
jgi:hypothetical protein